ncbi:MAG: DUF4358 domain-containing protein [Eubacteriales bacterium]|nr:DUF4358 domain-containing protein [Eubacteriales bacterium]
MSGLMRYIGVVKYVLLLGLLAFVIVLQGGDKISRTPMEEVVSAVTGAIDMEGLSQGDNRMVKRLYGLLASDYDGTALYVSGSNMEVEEILIVRLKDPSQADGVESAVQGRVKRQLESFEGYGPEQCSLLKAHVLDVRGNYILFVVNKDGAAADQAFRKSL